MASPAGVRFLITYGPVPRIWCQACDKAETLPDLEAGTAELLQAQHRCGERTSPWAKAGMR